jgi:hypothetical protein
MNTMQSLHKPLASARNRVAAFRPALLTLLVAALALPAAAMAQAAQAPAPKATGKTQPKPKSFDGLTCQSDIAAELVGRIMPNGKVVEIEARYKSLKLQGGGSQGMPDEPYILGFWEICGREYVLLEPTKQKTVKAVLTSPVLPAEAVIAVGQCRTADGRELGQGLFLRPKAKDKGPWTVDTVWTVREPQIEFVTVKDKKLTCSE